jgi:hypothetical protein
MGGRALRVSLRAWEASGAAAGMELPVLRGILAVSFVRESRAVAGVVHHRAALFPRLHTFLTQHPPRVQRHGD